MSDLKSEVRGTLSGAIGALVAAGAKSFVEWVATRPVKRAIERRRARKAKADPPADPPCRKE